MVGQQELSDTLVGVKIGTNTLENIWYYPVNLNVHITYNPEISLLGIDATKCEY